MKSMQKCKALQVQQLSILNFFKCEDTVYCSSAFPSLFLLITSCCLFFIPDIESIWEVSSQVFLNFVPIECMKNGKAP